jgi:AcrR family transcriptional regulator
MTDPPRTRRRRKDARPAEIIEAGLQEFARHGLAGARMEDVALRAGIAKGTVYRYFEDKETLFIAAVRSCIPTFTTPVGEMIDAFPGPSADLLRIAITRGHAMLSDPDARVLMRILITEGARFPALTEIYHREVLALGRSLIGRIVARGIARGEFRPGPAADLPIVIFSPVLMAAIWGMNFERHEPISPDAFLQAHVDLVLHGLEARSDTAQGHGPRGG